MASFARIGKSKHGWSCFPSWKLFKTPSITHHIRSTSFKYYRYVEDDSYFQFIWHHIDFTTEFRSVICFHIHWPKICLSLELCHQISFIPPATDVTVSDVNGICLKLGITFLWEEDGRRLVRVFSHQLQQMYEKTNIIFIGKELILSHVKWNVNACSQVTKISMTYLRQGNWKYFFCSKILNINSYWAPYILAYMNRDVYLHLMGFCISNDNFVSNGQKIIHCFSSAEKT